MRAVLACLFDAGSLFELQPAYGSAVITALARLGGRAVAVVANQPMVRAGAVDVAAATKAARFIEVTSAFHLPLVMLADNPGVLPGSASERAGILRAAARMFAAQHRCGVPKLHVTIRKAFGFGSSVMGMNAFDGQTVSLAFPGVILGGIPAAVGGRTAKADAETQRALVDTEAAGPWRLAASVTYDEVVDPRELRNALLAGLRLAAARVDRPGRTRDQDRLPALAATAAGQPPHRTRSGHGARHERVDEPGRTHRGRHRRRGRAGPSEALALAAERGPGGGQRHRPGPPRRWRPRSGRRAGRRSRSSPTSGTGRSATGSSARPLRQLRGLDIVVNNAGVVRDRMLFNLTESDWDAVVRIHLKGHAAVSRARGAYWRRASEGGRRPGLRARHQHLLGGGSARAVAQPNYSAAKAGITALTLSTARGSPATACAPTRSARVPVPAMTAHVFGGRPTGGELDILAPERVAHPRGLSRLTRRRGINGQVFVVYGDMVALLAAPTVERTFTAAGGAFTVDELAGQLTGYFSGGIPAAPSPRTPSPSSTPR